MMPATMRLRDSESGFTLVELMIASVITMVVMGVAFSTFRDALALNEAVITAADSSQNLRAGTNLIVRDLLQTGRNISIGGIPIPSGPGADPVHRPGPPGTSYTFANTVAGSMLRAITSGATLGPTVAGRPTDLVTIVMDDPYLEKLNVFGPNSPDTRPKLSADGSSLDVKDTGWLDGDPEEGIAPIEKGDLILFQATGGGQALQTVTGKEGHVITFDSGDPFQFNQRGAPSGSITQILAPAPSPCDDLPPPTGVACSAGWKAQRVHMFTYYVHTDASMVPRLMRAINHAEPQALAGVVESLELSYDLVDGVNNNLTQIKTLPVTISGNEYSASQIRKVNLRIGVRSETKAARTNDYPRSYVSTVVSLRNLAYVDRYDTAGEEEEQ